MTDQIKAADTALEVAHVEQHLIKTQETLESFIKKANDEIKAAGETSAETRSAVEKLTEKATELTDKVMELEQKQAERFVEPEQQKSVGEMFVSSEGFENFVKHGSKFARMEYKTAIVSDYDGGMSQPLVPGDRMNMIWHEPNRRLRIRDILPQGRTTSNTVFFPKENVFTNNAAEVRDTTASPIVQADNVTKPESAITFTSDSEVVATIAHWIPVSKQVLDDSPLLASYIDSRLMYGLKLREDGQLLNGTGITGYISGINTNSTAYAQADSPESYSTTLDYIADACRQLEQANYMPSAVIMNPKDFWDTYLSKGTDGHYKYAQPTSGGPLSLWGLDVVVTNTQSAGTVTVLDPMAYMLVDRQDAVVEAFEQDSTNVQKNMVTIRAEERLALVSFSTSGAVKITV